MQFIVKITVSAIWQVEVSFTIVLFQVLYSSRQLRYRLQVTADGSTENEEVNRMTGNETVIENSLTSYILK